MPLFLVFGLTLAFSRVLLGGAMISIFRDGQRPYVVHLLVAAAITAVTWVNRSNGVPFDLGTYLTHLVFSWILMRILFGALFAYYFGWGATFITLVPAIVMTHYTYETEGLLAVLTSLLVLVFALPAFYFTKRYTDALERQEQMEQEMEATNDRGGATDG